MAKALRVPLDTRLEELRDIPYTISFVIRKRLQIDNLNELPKEKRPPERMIWDGTVEEIEDWLKRVFDHKSKDSKDFIYITEDDIER